MISGKKLWGSMVLAAITVVVFTPGCGPRSDLKQVDRLQGRSEARATLMRLVQSSAPTSRAHAIEALAETVGIQAGYVFERALADRNPMVQFAAAMAVADVKYAPARAELGKMADQAGPDKRVYSAVIYALHNLGDDTYTSDLARLLFHREKEVRADAAMIMGKMRDRSGINLLKTLLEEEQDPSVQMQIHESLAVLGEELSGRLLEAYTKTQFLDERLLAVMALGRIDTSDGPSILRDLLHRDKGTVAVAAAGSLARVGQVDEDGYRLCIESLRQPQKVLEKAVGNSRLPTDVEIATLQRLAAMSLGWMGRPEAIGA